MLALTGPCPAALQFFETFSYLPPLTNEQIARQVDYIVGNGERPPKSCPKCHILPACVPAPGSH